MSPKTINNQPIYLDYHSTTPVDPRVAEKVLHYMTTAFGNASSTDHVFGDKAAEAVSQASQHLSKLVGASPQEIIFTSGATESINLALQGSIARSHDSCPRIAISPVEHKAVLDTCQALEKKGLAEIIYLHVDSQGRLDLNHLEQRCRDGIALLGVMAANNEVGNIYPIEKIGHIACTYNVSFLCDASQAVGKIPINFAEWGITYLAVSGHKFYAPQGVGALAVKRDSNLEPIIFGGGHQKGLRSGTLNVPGIVGLGEASRLRQVEMEEDERAIAIKRDKLQNLLQERIPDLIVNGELNSRLAGNLHISIPGVPNSAVLARVRHQLAISTGASCSSGVTAPSHVLQAMNLPEDWIDGALRLGLGKFTSDQELDRAAEILSEAVTQIYLLLD
jgi:cysteine desulfurase